MPVYRVAAERGDCRKIGLQHGERCSAFGCTAVRPNTYNHFHDRADAGLPEERTYRGERVVQVFGVEAVHEAGQLEALKAVLARESDLMAEWAPVVRKQAGV